MPKVKDWDPHVGDACFVVFGQIIHRRTSVASVQKTKRGPKVRDASGCDWDIAGRCKWGERTRRREAVWQSVAHLEPWSPTLEELWRRQALRGLLSEIARVTVPADHLDALLVALRDALVAAQEGRPPE